MKKAFPCFNIVPLLFFNTMNNVIQDVNAMKKSAFNSLNAKVAIV